MIRNMKKQYNGSSANADHGSYAPLWILMGGKRNFFNCFKVVIIDICLQVKNRIGFFKYPLLQYFIRKIVATCRDQKGCNYLLPFTLL